MKEVQPLSSVLRFSKLIITLEDRNYMAEMKEKLAEIRGFYKRKGSSLYRHSLLHQN